MTQKTGGPQWTEAQKKTIEERNKNILVSAAAGSGKTAVLVERIKKLIIEDKQDISGFLITTFTKAAAEEMKHRLENALKEEMKDADAEEKNFLSKQLFALPGASISTFHSFAIEIIRQYFYLTDLEPGFKIADEIQTEILIKEAMDELFEIRYEENSEEFKNFLRAHSSDRNDNSLKDNIKSTYESLQSIPEYFEWANSRVELMNSDNPFVSTGTLEFILKMAAERIRDAADLMREGANILYTPDTPLIFGKASANADMIEAFANKVKGMLSDGMDLVETYEFIGKFIDNITYVKMVATKAEKEFYEALKGQSSASISEGKKLIESVAKYFGSSIEDMNREIRGAYADTKYFLEMIMQFEEILKEKKAEEGCIDFNDVMHLAIKILKNDQAAEELRDRYKYIFVDEYQDSNDLQEHIVERIKRNDNLFMVGDVKQSIYRFRLAEPELFMARDRNYRNSGDEASTVIDLNSNFRSKSCVTESVNAVFESCMEGYDEEAKLHCTISADPGHKTEIHILDNKEGEKVIIADIIRECLGSDFYDSKRNVTRPIGYRDIAVLSRGKGEIASLEHYLNNEGIPAYGMDGESFFDTVELQVFMNVLKVIDNMMQDIPLISVMRSVLFGFSTQELAKIRIAFREESYAGAVLKYMVEGPDEALKNKIAAMNEQIEKWRMLSRAVPVAQLIQILLYDTGFYDYCSGLPAGKKRASNLRLLVEKAISYEEKSRGGLYGFLSYADAVKNSKKTEVEAKTISENEDVVQIMTVHKSKGLEFPVVILMGAGKSLSGGGKTKPLHKDLGMSLKLSDWKNHWYKKTVLQTAIADKQRYENLEEEVRILYVAMTRAMDKLCIVGNLDDPSKIKTKSAKTSFLDLVCAPLISNDLADVFIHENVTEPDVHLVNDKRSPEELLFMVENADYEINEEIIRRLEYVYPYADEEHVKIKYSVSELGVSPDHQEAHIAEYKADGRQRVDAAQAGTAMHLIMEMIDFGEAMANGMSYIEEFADSLVSREIMTTDERRIMNCQGINAFFENEVGRRAAIAFTKGNLRKEKEFILQKEISGRDVIVQGIIDCWFEEDGEIVLIDYKNSNMNNRTEEDIVDTYREQINLYKEALEESTGFKVKESYLYLFGPGKFITIESVK